MPLARVTAVLAAAFAVAGCGGPEPAARAHDGRVQITLDEFSISPQEVVVAPGRITLRIVNRGRLRHDFRLWGPGGEPVRVESLFAGDRTVRTADLAPGRYRMVCTVFNYAELGMYGTLTVR